MDQLESGWPLGLQPLNGGVGTAGNRRGCSGSVSFSTLLTGSPTSTTDSSSDLDSRSAGSFFQDKSSTLGSLLGASSLLELSRRSARARTSEASRDRRNCKPKSWFFSLCSKLSTDAVTLGEAPSLGYFLEAERRAATYGRNSNYANDDPSKCSQVASNSDPSSVLLVSTQVVRRSVVPLNSWGRMKAYREQVEDGSDYGFPLLFSCLRRQLI